MKKMRLLHVCVLSGALSVALVSSGEETTGEKMETKKNEAVDAVKGSYRGAKDKACEMVNGKMQCLGQKIKNKSKDLSDKAKTKAKELENKVD